MGSMKPLPGRDPFDETADTDFYWSGPARLRPLTEVQAAISGGSVAVACAGAPGSGKSSFLIKLAEHLAARGVHFIHPDRVYCCGARASSGQLSRSWEGADAVAPPRSQSQNYLAVLLLDDADHLSRADMVQLRDWWRTLREKRDNVALVVSCASSAVDPDSPSRRQDLRSMIDRVVALQSLTQSDIEELVHFRLKVAGWEREDVFTPLAIEKIAFYAKGTPGRLVQICSRVIQLAEEKGNLPVGPELVKEAAHELFLPSHLRDFSKKISLGLIPVPPSLGEKAAKPSVDETETTIVRAPPEPPSLEREAVAPSFKEDTPDTRLEPDHPPPHETKRRREAPSPRYHEMVAPPRPFPHAPEPGREAQTAPARAAPAKKRRLRGTVSALAVCGIAVVTGAVGYVLGQADMKPAEVVRIIPLPETPTLSGSVNGGAVDSAESEPEALSPLPGAEVPSASDDPDDAAPEGAPPVVLPPEQAPSLQESTAPGEREFVERNDAADAADKTQAQASLEAPPDAAVETPPNAATASAQTAEPDAAEQRSDAAVESEPDAAIMAPLQTAAEAEPDAAEQRSDAAVEGEPDAATGPPQTAAPAQPDAAVDIQPDVADTDLAPEAGASGAADTVREAEAGEEREVGALQAGWTPPVDDPPQPLPGESAGLPSDPATVENPGGAAAPGTAREEQDEAEQEGAVSRQAQQPAPTPAPLAGSATEDEDGLVQEQRKAAPAARPEEASASLSAFDSPPPPPPQRDGTVMRAQALLAQLGLYRDAIDGLLGQRTTAAIREFQRRASMAQTGEISQALLETLEETASAPEPAPVREQAVRQAPVVDAEENNAARDVQAFDIMNECRGKEAQWVYIEAINRHVLCGGLSAESLIPGPAR